MAPAKSMSKRQKDDKDFFKSKLTDSSFNASESTAVGWYLEKSIGADNMMRSVSGSVGGASVARSQAQGAGGGDVGDDGELVRHDQNGQGTGDFIVDLMGQ